MSAWHYQNGDKMPLNLPPKVRSAIYILVVMGTSVVLPLHAAGVLNDLALSVWTSVSGAASLLAALNVASK